MEVSTHGSVEARTNGTALAMVPTTSYTPPPTRECVCGHVWAIAVRSASDCVAGWYSGERCRHQSMGTEIPGGHAGVAEH
eukprot:5920237-Pyramimonas_sp.AAC.1